MTEDAQSALLKTLEEPPAARSSILCAEDEERLLPTIRSRCVRVRLGSDRRRAIEAILVEHDVADAPTAARLARLAGGRPGLALELARAPEARPASGRGRPDAARSPDGARARRLASGSATWPARAADRRARAGAGRTGRERRTAARGRSRGRRECRWQRRRRATDGGRGRRRRRRAAVHRCRAPAAALALVGDLARRRPRPRAGHRSASRARCATRTSWRTSSAAAGCPRSAMRRRTSRRLDMAAERLEGNVSPELVLDALAIAWAA